MLFWNFEGQKSIKHFGDDAIAGDLSVCLHSGAAPAQNEWGDKHDRYLNA